MVNVFKIVNAEYRMSFRSASVDTALDTIISNHPSCYFVHAGRDVTAYGNVWDDIKGEYVIEAI